MERKPARLVTVAVANKMARIIWAVMARDENYRAVPAAACRLRESLIHNQFGLERTTNVMPIGQAGERDNPRDSTRSERDSLMRTRSTAPIMASGLVPRATGRTHECT